MDPNPSTRPLPNDPLIHSHGIELVPQYVERDRNPGIEVTGDSSLEVANPHLYPSSRQVAPGTRYFDPIKLSSPPSWEKHPGTPVAVDGAPIRPYTATSATSSPAPPYGFPISATAPAGHGQDQNRPYSDGSFQSPFDQSPLVVPPGDGVKRERICGVRRQLFWVLLAVAVFVLVVAVATGVGVGVGLSGRDERSTVPSPTPSPSSTRTFPFPVPVATSTITPSSNNIYPTIPCPSANLTLFTPSSAHGNPSRKYLLLCGRDYNSAQGTQDMYNTPTDTLAECIDLCAAQEGCVGAGWGKGAGGKGADKSKAICWLKSRLASWQKSESWAFVVEDGVDG